jgi:RHS repeat-associated protein
LTSITDAANSAQLWALNGATAIDADGNITKESLGNGLITDRLHSPITGRIQTIKTSGGAVQNLAFGFDHLGDLTSRSDGVNNVNETFSYDALNRLTGTSMTGATALTKSYGYSSTGNLTYKSDVGTLVYPLSSELKNHGVKSVTGTVNGLVNPTYEYDFVGNLLYEKTGTTIQRQIDWTGFNMPSKITKGSSTIDFLYDADHARTYEKRMTGTVTDSQTYFVNAGNGLFFEIETKGTVTEWKHYLHAPSGLLMMRSIKSNTTAKTDVYFHKDHLGSITTITNNIGAILEKNSYDAFGKRRNANGSDATTTINSLTRRGFTEHEMLPEVNMIHMNGRVYEPTLGRFMSADPNVQFAGFSQSYNRYSYSLNNPLSFTDPSGYGIRDFFRSLDDAVRHPGDAQALYAVIRNRPDGGAHDRYIMSHSWARAAGYAVAAYYGGAYATAFISGYETYLAGGSNSDIFRASATSYVTSSAFSGVGAASSAVGGAWGVVIKIDGSAAVGCASSQASGGSCRQGAMFSGGFAAADALYQYATITTDGLKQTACDAGQSICQSNEWNELRTDGAREPDTTYNPDGNSNWLTESGMANEASGQHIYDPNGMLANKHVARFINHVSKIHDFFNSVNYSSGGLYLTRGVTFDSVFQLYSFAGMPVAGALTAAHYFGENPALLSGQLDARRRRSMDE